MALTDKEELELRVKALTEALEKTKEELAARSERRVKALEALYEEKVELTEKATRLEAKLHEVETELGLAEHDEQQAIEELDRVRKHARSV